jgi:hypothetical protein
VRGENWLIFVVVIRFYLTANLNRIRVGQGGVERPADGQC